MSITLSSHFSRLKKIVLVVGVTIFVPSCPKAAWDTLSTGFIGVTTLFALRSTIFEKSVRHCLTASVSYMHNHITF